MNRTKLLIGFCLLGGVLWWVSGADRPESPARSAPPQFASDAQQSKLIATSDLPPAGTRSLFDHHIARLGELPYPFVELMDSFKPLDRWGEGTVSLLIPDGRSLARGHADYAQPRVLVAAQLDPPATHSDIAPIYSGRLFIGYVEAIQALEIISYNEAAGRFEFQLVHDYCEGCRPRITYAKRDICMACHHAATPIFSVRPWEETNANSVVARRIAAKQGIAWELASTTRYHGAPVSTQVLMPETFDELTGMGSELILAQRIWIEGCGEQGLACRRALLGQALSLLMQPGAFDPASSANDRLRTLQKLTWPTKGIAVQNDRLPSRNPPEPSVWDIWQAQLKRLWSRMPVAGKSRDDSAARLAEFEKLPRLPVALDPLTPRAPQVTLSSDSLAGVHAIVKLFSSHDRALLFRIAAGDAQRIQGVIESGAIDDALTAGPLVRVNILKKLNSVLGQEALDYCCMDTSAMSPPRHEIEAGLSISPGSALEAFEEYCFACHRGNPVERLNFMAGNTETEVMDAIRATKRIRKVLNYSEHGDTDRRAQLMPPPSSEQRERLEAAIAAQQNDLDRMLGAIRLAD